MFNQQPERFDPAQPLRGLRVRSQFSAYLAWECELAEDRNRQEVTEILQRLLNAVASPKIRPRDWERLAEACLIIGSKAIDFIEKRLEVVVGPGARENDFDVRAAAIQLHSFTLQARKAKNSLAMRKKCVKAILSSLENMDDATDQILLMPEINGADGLRNWTKEVYERFASLGTIRELFLKGYREEWFEFCEDAIFFLSGSNPVPEGLMPTLRYESFIGKLVEETDRARVNWIHEPTANSRQSRPDIVGNNGVTVELKKRPDHFSFIINVPSLYELNLREAPLAIMSILERKPGFQSVDVAPQAKDSRSIKIDIWDKYTMAQITVAQQEILDYLGSTEL